MRIKTYKSDQKYWEIKENAFM